MPTDFDDDPGDKARRSWIALLALALMFVVAIALANRQVDRTTAIAPAESPWSCSSTAESVPQPISQRS